MAQHKFAHDDDKKKEARVTRDRRRENRDREYASDKWSRDDFFRDLGRASRPTEDDKPPQGKD